MKSGQAKGTVKTKYSTVIFTSADFFDITGFKTNKGRFFDNTDVNKRAKVLVAGPKIASDLFGSAALALDKKVSIDNVNYTVVGIFGSNGSGAGWVMTTIHISSAHTQPDIFIILKNSLCVLL